MITGSSCADTAIDTSKKIESPVNKIIPMQGRWIIERRIPDSDGMNHDEDNNTWVGKEAVFSGESAVLGDNFWDNIKYKTKRVVAEEYFMYENIESAKKIGITDNEIFVLTASSDEKFLYEIIKINDNEALMNIDGELLYLKKLSDESEIRQQSNRKESKEVVPINTGVKKGNSPLRSGILLGMRTPLRSIMSENSEGYDGYSYRTLWIASNNRKLHPILISSGIFLPRKNGFWRLESRRVSQDGWTEDVLYARSVSDISEEAASKKYVRAIEDLHKEGILKKTILYVGNDYVSVDVTRRWKYKNSEKEWIENSLQTIPIDNVQSDRGVRISEAAGEEGLRAMESAVANAFNDLGIKGMRGLDAVRNGESFALFRKMGHWYIMGRINYIEDNSNLFFDFKINIVPPTKLVMYDNLHLAWTEIKDRIPQAIDAFTSPNRDIAIIQTRNELLIYSLEQNRLSEKPLAKVRLNDGESVVMAEWATGNYVEKWENAYLKNVITNKATSLSN